MRKGDCLEPEPKFPMPKAFVWDHSLQIFEKLGFSFSQDWHPFHLYSNIVFIIFKYLKKIYRSLHLRQINGLTSLLSQDARKEMGIDCARNCVAFIMLIVLSCHLRLGLCTLDLNCTVLQTNMCCRKSLYNTLLIRLFPCGSCINILRTTFASICSCTLSLSLLC